MRIAASALRRHAGRILDGEVQLQRAVRLLHRPDVGVGLALRDLVRLVERPRGDLGRHLAELIGVAEKQAGAIRGIGKHVERLEDRL